MNINVGFLVSYDYKYLKSSLPLIYEDSSSITLAIDINRNTWSGSTFNIDNSFFEWIKEIDLDNKISIYEDDFYKKELSSIENDTRERKLLANKMGEGWIIQIDSDEFFLNFNGFCKYLKKHEYLLNGNKKIQIAAYWITIFKKLKEGVLYIENAEKFYLATNTNSYRIARNCKVQTIRVPFLVVHYSWARSEEELNQKISNWGHNKDFDIDKYLNFWKNIDKRNYKEFSNIHPFIKNAWKKLDYCEGKTIDEVIRNLSHKEISVSKPNLIINNIIQFLKYKFK
jgi:hypothetical protein